MKAIMGIVAVLATIATPSFAAVPPSVSEDLIQRMAGYYKPVLVQEFDAQARQTALPLNAAKVGNWDSAKAHIPETALDLLKNNGVVVTDSFRNDKVGAFYDVLKMRGLPIFVTTDSLLHLYHIQFGETLRAVEEKRFFADLLALSRGMKEAGLKLHENAGGISKEAARRCVAYFAVAEQLLGGNGEIPSVVADDVKRELALIEAHNGFAESAVFKYKEDYSQYAPRGHYTRSENLKKYFKAMMWYGRMAFLVKGRTNKIPDALVSEEEAKIQTLAAMELAGILAANPQYENSWNRIYAVTAYYVGFADDLTPLEYVTIAKGMNASETSLLGALITNRWLHVQKALASLRTPEIYGGTGMMEGPPVPIATEEDLNKALAATQGMRFMGQRYVPDSYIMGRLVYPSVGIYKGNANPFTLVNTGGGPGRGFPRGLDVMAVLGSQRALEILAASGDDAYERYDDKLKGLTGKFSSISEPDWNRNMYWSWLHCLRALLQPVPSGYPSFMQNAAWQDKQINAVLGSWSQLRHDTILYAKQSYTLKATAIEMPPPMVEGYVEPAPEFYARLLALTQMSKTGLTDMGVLDEASHARLTALENILNRLIGVSILELQNKQLTKADYNFIRSFGERLEAVVSGVDNEGLETTIVADVHTDSNSGMVLEEGTGRLRTIVVAYPMPDGGTTIGFGPVFSYYEFKQPMANRLTDEEWKNILHRNAPALPEWTASFSVPATGR